MIRQILPVALSFVFPINLHAEESSQAGTTESQIKVLVVDGFSNHDWRKTTAWVKGFLAKDGRFEVEVSTAPEKKDSPGWNEWRPKFKGHDVVIQNCNDIRGGPQWPEEVQRALEDYLKEGGGLYVLHSANNAFPKWEEYNRMIGLGWRNKDFGEAITIKDGGEIERIPAGTGRGTGHGPRVNAVLTRLGDHPIHKGLPRKWMAADLEVYSYARGPAENLTVMAYAKEPVTGLNFPIEWSIAYGKGRVYNSTYGHVWHDSNKPDAIRCVAFQTIFPRALEWLATGEVTMPVPDDFPTEEKVSLR